MLAMRRDVVAFLRRTAARYGDVAWFRVGPTRVVLLNHPDYIREVLQTNSRNFVKGRPLHLARHLLGEGLLTSEGDVHQQQSRTVQPALHAERIQAYGAVMTDCAERWCGAWCDGAAVDMLREMTGLATTIAGRTLFHWDLGPDDATRIVTALEDASRLFSRASVPFAEWLLKLPLPSTRRFYRAKALLDEAIHGLIAERRRDGRGRDDVLSLLLAQQAAGGATATTDTQLRDQALTLFLTALDTTSLALTWTWYVLSQHPEEEAQLHAELDRVLGDRLPTTDDVEQLAATRRIFLESMRLYPPIYAVAREALDAFEVGGYTIPAGTLVLMSPYVMQRDPRYYRDPERFDPRRWDSRSGPQPPRFAYFPFGGGPRGCIGQSYAMLEGVLTLAALARRWRMRLVPGQRIALLPLINLRPRYGMRMLLERRARPA